MADDKKPALKYDWDSLPLAPDDDWDNIPLPEPAKPSSAFAEKKAGKIAGPALGPSRPKPNSRRNGRIPFYLNTASLGRAPVFADDHLGGLLSDEGGLTEDFDNLVDVSSDEVDDIDIGNVTAMPDEFLALAHPAARYAAGAVSPPARPEPLSSNAKAEGGKYPQSRLSDKPEEGSGSIKNRGAIDLRLITSQKVELGLNGLFPPEGPPAARPEKGPSRGGESPANQADEKPGPGALSGGQSFPAPVLGAAKTGPLKELKAVRDCLKGPDGSFKAVKNPLAVVALLLLVLISLSFGGYKLFFAVGQEAARAVDPAALPRVPEPGLINLAPFFIIIPAEAGASESILEMTFAIYYHDINGKEVLESRMLAVRDTIYNLASAKGGLVAGSRQARRELQDELLHQLNEVVGGGNLLDRVKIEQVHSLIPR